MNLYYGYTVFFKQRLPFLTSIKLTLLTVFFTIIIFSSGSIEALALDVKRGPYLQNATKNAMTVRWRTSDDTDSVVKYGSSPNALSKTKSVDGVRQEHEVRITGLSTNTRYYYSIGSSSAVLAGGNSMHYFKTLPSVDSKAPIRFWVLGDSGSEGSRGDRVRDAYLELAKSEKPADFLLMLGDNAYADGSDSQFQVAVFDRYQKILRNKVLWSCIGNHDSRDCDPQTGKYRGRTGPNMGHHYYQIHTFPKDGEAGGLASSTEAYYSYDYGNIHFVCLDTTTRDGYGNSLEPNGPMAQWLRLDLASTNQDWIVAFFHHPPHSRGSHDGSSNVRVNLTPILEAGGVDLVLSGHSHDYERSYLLDGLLGKLKGGDKLSSRYVKDGGDGREDGDGAYHKPMGKSSHNGTVYVVAGSSSQASPAPLDHPAMVYAVQALGSCIVDVTDKRMDFRFLREKTNPIQVDDHFTIIKDGDSVNELIVKVNAGNNDAEEKVSTGVVDIASSDLEMVEENSTQVVGVRFAAVNLDKTKKIESAYIQFTSDELDSDVTQLIIHGENVDNSTAYRTEKNNISSRKKTSASVNWSPPAWTTAKEAGSAQRTADVTNIVKEIMARGGWIKGGSIAFIISGSGKRVAKSFDGGDAPVLRIRWADAL